MKKILLLLLLTGLLTTPELLSQSVSNVSISGLFIEAEPVTGSYLEDLSGITDPQYEYVWYRVNVGVDSTEVGLSSNTYTIQAADIGKRMLFKVILLDGTAKIDSAYSALSPVVTANSIPVASGVSVTVLSLPNPGATLLGSYTYSDAENDPQGTSTFEWLIADTEAGFYFTIPGATGQTYVMVVGDVGKWIKFRVTPVSSNGSTPGNPVTSSVAVEVVAASNSAPVASAVSVSQLSDLNVGSTLLGSYTYSDADNDPQGSSIFQWSKSNNSAGPYADIPGANSIAYVIQMADTGRWFRFSVTPVASSGVLSGTRVSSSNQEGPVNNAPYITAPTLPGTVPYPGSLAPSYVFYDPDLDAEASEYTWYRDNVVIPGANDSTYILVAEDQGTKIKVKVLPKSATGIPNTGTAKTSGDCEVAISTKPLAEDVCIKGHRRLNGKLTGDYTYRRNGTSGEGATLVEWLVNDVVVKSGTILTASNLDYYLHGDTVDMDIKFRVTPRTGSIIGDPFTSASFTKITNSKTSFSINEEPEIMTAIPAVGSIPGATWEFTGDGIDEAGGEYYFDPGDPSLVLAESPYEIKEIYTMVEGCVQNAYISFNVDEATVFFNPAQFRDFFCYEDVDVTIDVTGLPPAWTGTGPGISYLPGSGSFSLTSPIPGGIISYTDKQVRVNPQAIGPGNGLVYLVYTYTLMNAIEIFPGLYNYIPVMYAIKRPFVIDFIGSGLSITNLPDEYCEEGTPFDIFADNMLPGGGTGSWSSPMLASQDNLIATVDPSLISGGGNTTINFTYTSPIGCQRSVSSDIFINPSPSADFDIVDGCIEGLNDTIMFTNLTTSTDPVTAWLWTFDDLNNNVSSSFEPGHLYKTSGIRNVELIAFTSNGCRDTAKIPIRLGVKPSAEFYWEDDCFSEGDFLNLFDATISQAPIDSSTWLFDGAGALRTLGLSDATYLKTGAPGKIKVDYFVYTDFPNCSDTVSKTIFIRPTITLADGDYYEDFETTDTVWLPDNLPKNSWMLGTPNRSTINSAASGDNAYFTAFNPLNQSQVNYAVESPCFDFTGMSRPMIKLKVWKDFDKNRDGAALQFKIGNDPLWEHVGTLDDGIEWYNSVTINGRPGGTQIGWTSLKENPDYTESRQKLDFLNNNKDVKFRIVYGSDGTSLANDGFAFDDIWIGERTRTVLVEHFANNAETVNSIRASSVVNEIVENASKDVVNIQYHTNYPGEDLFYYDNPADPSARKLYYGLTKIPYTLFGGGVNSSGDFAKLYDYIIKDADSLDLKKRSMIDPFFEIEVTAAISGGVVTVTGQLKALTDIVAESNMTLYVAVVAKEITSVSALNGDSNFRNVLRKMLPSAGGTDIKKSWNSGETLTFGDFSWVISRIYDATELEVIVFIQNNNTKQVFQAATSGILGGVTAIGDFNAENNRLSIYPNPASNRLDIAFGRGLSNDSRLVIYNNLGTAVKSLEIPRTTEQIVIDDLNLPDGLYIVRLYEGSVSTGYRKLIVTQR